MENFMLVMFPIMFTLVFGIIIFTMVKGLKEWNKNNNSPVLSVAAKVVAKRIGVTNHHASTDNSGMYNSTFYYVTFEVESKDRMELKLSGSEYGMLVEGDYGKLTFQGTRYKGFERE